jgi:hypothetical protein
MRGPSLAGFRVDMGEPGARRRIGNADEVVASGALNLPTRVARIALQRLVAVGTVEFEFGVAHSLHLFMRKLAAKSMCPIYAYFLFGECACRIE